MTLNEELDKIISGNITFNYGFYDVSKNKIKSELLTLFERKLNDVVPDKIRMLKSICKNDCSDRSYSNCGLKRGISGKCHVSDLIKRITEGK